MIVTLSITVFGNDKDSERNYLVDDLSLHQGVPMVFYDSQRATYLTKHQMYYERTNTLISDIISFEKLNSSKLKKLILHIIKHI